MSRCACELPIRATVAAGTPTETERCISCVRLKGVTVPLWIPESPQASATYRSAFLEPDQFLPTALAPASGLLFVTTEAPKNISDLWIVPIFLDFWRRFGRVASDLSGCQAVDYPVLWDVGMGVAKTRCGVSTEDLVPYVILLNAAKN